MARMNGERCASSRQVSRVGHDIVGAVEGVVNQHTDVGRVPFCLLAVVDLPGGYIPAAHVELALAGVIAQIQQGANVLPGNGLELEPMRFTFLQELAYHGRPVHQQRRDLQVKGIARSPLVVGPTCAFKYFPAVVGPDNPSPLPFRAAGHTDLGGKGQFLARSNGPARHFFGDNQRCVARAGVFGNQGNQVMPDTREPLRSDVTDFPGNIHRVTCLR